MNEAFQSIDPNGISIGVDGSVYFRDVALRDASIKLGSDGATPMADNAGTCTNNGVCSGANLDCTNTGTCTGDNYGQCHKVAPGAPG